MGARTSLGRGREGNRADRLLPAGVLLVALILMLEASPVAGATPKACWVTNTDSGQTYTRLQQAVKAANRGARLIVKGTCHGGTFIDKNLVIVGKETKRTGTPILDGDGKVRVLTIQPKVEVSILSLVVVRGRTRSLNGGGIANKGRLTLRDVAVRANKARRGAGIYNEGVVRLTGRSRISRNGLADVTGTSGAGVYNVGRLVLADASRIYQNRCSGLHNVGTVIMRGTSTIGPNTTGLRICGGSSNSGILTMNDASSIKDDGSLGNGGTLTMNDDSSIHGNVSIGSGGGVSNSGTLTMNDTSSIYHNHTWGGPAMITGMPGGGVYNTGTLTMNDDSSIDHNSITGGAGGRTIGGGVYNEGTLTMTGSSRITENSLPTYGNAVLGGGLYNASGGTLNGVNCAPHTYANVYGNTPDDCYIEP